LKRHALLHPRLYSALLVAAVVMTSVIFAQQIWVGGRRGMAPRWPLKPQEYFNRFSPIGYAIGVNVVLDAMTH
jgi:hypothetical protein